MDTASTMTVLGHEFGHRWLAFPSFLDGAGNASYDLLNFDGGVHWSFHTDSEGSLMHGNDWQDNGDGTFSATTGAHTRYSPLDRYLMGLARKGTVPDFYYIADPDQGRRGALPVFEMTVRGRRVDVTVDDVIAAEGRRRPAPVAAPKSFRTAFLLVGLVGQGVSQESIDKLDRYRRRWAGYFREATGELGEVKTALFPR